VRTRGYGSIPIGPMLGGVLGSRSASSPGSPAPGDQLGPYRIEAVLGEGGMGQVFRAAHADTGRLVALKVLKPGAANDPEHARRFVREARAAREVEHPNLVGVLDAGEADGRPYLALELVQGQSVDERVRSGGPLALDEALRLARQVAAGLDALHGAGIVHRDNKASNIMLDLSGDAALTDFGLAKGGHYSALTRAGTLMGTMDYMAPELIRGETPGTASDIYAFGCVMYECFAGRPPFGGKGFLQLGMAHLEETPADPCAERDDVPAGVGEAVCLALAKQPEQRPATATAYAELISVSVRPET